MYYIWCFAVEKCVCQCSIMSHLHRTGNPKLLPQTVDFWIDACVLLASNCVQICKLELLGFIVRYTDLPWGCVSWLIEWNRARYSVSDVTRGYILLMYPAVYLLTYLSGGMVLGRSNCTIPIINQVFPQLTLATYSQILTNNLSHLSAKSLNRISKQERKPVYLYSSCQYWGTLRYTARKKSESVFLGSDSMPSAVHLNILLGCMFNAQIWKSEHFCQ